MSEKKVDVKYLEVTATVEADVTINVRDIFDKLNLEQLKVVRAIVNEKIKIEEEEL